MLTMDVFKQDAFSALSLTEAVRRAQTIPGVIGSMGLFMPKPVRAHTVAVEWMGSTLRIIQTSERGAPRTRRSLDRRNIVDLRTRRIEESSHIQADEISAIRAFGSETELKTVQKEIASRQQMCIDDLAATVERLRLSCVTGGVLKDADDSTIYDYNTVFGIAANTEIAFDWANKTKVKQFVANNITRPMVRAMGGLATPDMKIVALCGDDFFDLAQENAEYRDVYKNTEKSTTLLNGTAFGSFYAWGVNWINYQGTDDNSTVAIPATKARFFPVGVRGLFQEAFAPAPTLDLVNTMGQEWYSRMILDKDRNEWADVEIESHRLPICTRPETLFSGRSGT